MKEKIVMACDHAGYEMKENIKNYLELKGYEVVDCGTYSADSCDYPDYAHKAGSMVNKGEVKRGIVICGSANGVSMTVNKYPHVRCALCWLPEIAHLGRQHNDCNMVGIPARYISLEMAKEIVDEFLGTAFEGGRHENRVNKICQVKN